MNADVRIAIDGFNLALPHGTGVATYGQALGDAITSLGVRLDGVFGIPVGIHPELREILFYEALGRGIPQGPGLAAVRAVREWFGQYRRTQMFDVPMRGLIVQGAIARRLPRFERIMSSARLFERADRYFARTGRFLPIRVSDPPHIMHWTYPVPIWMQGTSNVYTLHDLVPLKLPYATLDRKRLYYRMTETIVREADHVCTVSESSRDDVIAQFGIAGDRITNTYQCVSTAQTRQDHVGDVTALFGLKPRGYFLYYGAIEPKKNVGRLIEAYLGSQVKTPLVLVGAGAWQADEDLRLLATGAAGSHNAFGRRVASQVIRLQYLPRALLLQLIENAKGVIFPSLYEGFGLPVLEAMQLGTPVITSDRSSLPEVAGQAALMVDPYDVGALTAAILALDTDDALADRLAAAGTEQAQVFTQDRYRARLGAMYDTILAKAPRTGRHMPKGWE